MLQALVDYPDARKQLEYQAQLRISSNRKMSSALKESSSGSGNHGNHSSGNQNSNTKAHTIHHNLLKKTLSGPDEQAKSTVIPIT